MGSSKKTITDLQIVDLLEPGVAEAEGRRQAIMRCNGDSALYASVYAAYKKDYRKKYSNRFLQTIGYNPYTSALTRVLDKIAVKAYLVGKSLDVDTITILRGTYLDKYSTAKNYLQNNYDFVNNTEVLTVDGKVYKTLLVTNGGPTLHIDIARYYVDAIEERLNLYAYDGTSVWRPTGLNGALEEYLVGNILPTIVDNGGVPSYTVDTTLVVSPFTVITEYIPVEHFLLDIPEISYEVMYVTYTVVGGVVDEWFSYVENLDTIPSNLYVLSTINMTAILPLKENNTVYDLEERRRKRLLRKVGIIPKDMVQSLADPGLDNAYLWTGLPISNTDEVSIKVMFKTFDYLASGSGNIAVAISQLSMNYNFTISKTTYTGKIMDVGTYSKSLSGTDTPADTTGLSDEYNHSPGTYSTLVLRYQGSETEWRQITITNYTNSYTISGHSFTAYLTSSKDTGRLIIPLDVLNGLKYRDYVAVFESSLSMICYSVTVVKTKWYQTGIFKIFAFIVIIVVAIYTGYFDPEAFAASIGSMTATEMATAVLMSVAMSVGIQLILKAFGPEMGALIAIASIIALSYGGYMNMNLNNFNGYLATATNVLSTMDQAIQMKINEMMVKGKKELEEIATKTEALQVEMDKMRSLEGGMTFMINGFDDTAAYNTTPTVDSYYANMLGGSVFNFDVMYDVDGALEKRKVVNSG